MLCSAKLPIKCDNGIELLGSRNLIPIHLGKLGNNFTLCNTEQVNKPAIGNRGLNPEG